MDPSPLTRQSRPNIFQPKIVQLYLHLFSAEDDTLPPEGFWREFFLLPTSANDLRSILESFTAEDLLHIQIQTRSLLKRSIKEAQSGVIPRDENAFETLTAFLTCVLNKKYTNPSSDIIEILAGLDEVDSLFGDLINAIDATIRSGSRLEARWKAVRTALSLTAGAYQTGLVSYFTHRDLFPTLMKYIVETDEDSVVPLLLLGLLANYNKFEYQNPYQNRLDDFVNEGAIQRLVLHIGRSCSRVRDSYISVQDDAPEGWNLNSTLAFVGLRSLTLEGKTNKVRPSEEEAKELFDTLPGPEASIALPIYSLINANKLVASTLTTLMPNQKSIEVPFSAFLSLTSYLAHHAHRSQRCAHYTLLHLLSLRILVEDQVILKRICSADFKVPVRLCRQRPPHLPLVPSDRVPAAAMLDICTDTISHNLRRRLGVPLYSLALGIVLRIVVHLGRTTTRLVHHWSYVWGALLSLLRFLTQYASEISHLPQLKEGVCSSLTRVIAYCLSAGDTFLSDPSSYDDLFYKLVETGPVLSRFRDAYYGSDNTVPADQSINVLISVSVHYHDLLLAQHGRKTHQSPAAVQKVITEGYETLNLEPQEDFAHWEKWRESAWKAELKRITKTIVEDARRFTESR